MFLCFISYLILKLLSSLSYFRVGGEINTISPLAHLLGCYIYIFFIILNKRERREKAPIITIAT